MPCEDCARRRAAMKEWIAKKLGLDDAKQASDVQAKPSNSAAAPAEGGGQAGEASAQHEQRGLEAPQAANAGEGRLPVPRVRKAGSGKRGAR